VAKKIKAEANMGPVAVRIVLDTEIIDVPADDNHTVCRKGLDGDSSFNIVNRLAAEGGIQIEQSLSVRTTGTYSAGVTNGAAKAVGELLNGMAATDACAGFPAPVDKNSVPDCP